MNRRIIRPLAFVLGFAVALGLGSILVEDPPARAAVPPPPIDPLHQCVYERALIEPVPDSGGFPGQYVAQLPCGEGRYVVSGSCYMQFFHSDAEHALTGSHPYEQGSDQDVPEWAELHQAVDGENGWACRVNAEPVAKIAVGALCCF